MVFVFKNNIYHFFIFRFKVFKYEYDKDKNFHSWTCILGDGTCDGFVNFFDVPFKETLNSVVASIKSNSYSHYKVN